MIFAGTPVVLIIDSQAGSYIYRISYIYFTITGSRGS